MAAGGGRCDHSQCRGGPIDGRTGFSPGSTGSGVAEAAPWPLGEAWAFEEKCENLPQTPLDLQRLLLARLADLQLSLLHDDFAQGSTLCSLQSEQAVQNWMGDYLRHSQGRSYSIEREPHVVGERKPDIRARSANDASVPIEIKVAESCTLERLVAALIDQLCGQYLSSRKRRHGISLLIHQKARLRGWCDPKDGRRLDFAELVEHLRVRAKSIGGADADSPQPEIAAIGVSSCAAPVRRPSAMIRVLARGFHTARRVAAEAIFERLGIAAEMKPKAKLVAAGAKGETVIKGGPDIGFDQMSNIVINPKIESLGPLPATLQHYTDYAGGLVMAGGKGCW